MITQEYVKSLFDYREDGVLVWKYRPECNESWNHRCAYKVAGSFDKSSGYFRVGIDNVLYAVHKIIFLWHNGYMPELVDHKDNDVTNNRIDNLREADSSQNSCNTKIRSDNRLGHKNIQVTPDGTFLVRISKNGKRISKTHKSLEAAIEWRDTKLKELHGEFASTG